MATNKQYVGIDYIIEDLDLNYGFDDVNRSDIREYVGKTMGYINDPSTFPEQYAEIDITTHRGILPPDFYSMNEGAIIEKSTSIAFTDNPDLFSRFDADADLREDIDTEYYTYEIKEDYIFCGIEDTTLLMQYKALPIDINGEPKIPADEKVIRSVTDFCAERIAFKLYLKDRITKDKYQDIEQKSLFSTASAMTRLKMPTNDQLERMKNRAMTLFSNGLMHDVNFKNLGSRSDYARAVTVKSSDDTSYTYYVDYNGESYIDADGDGYID